MCTLTLAWRVFPDAPVVVAANRDEATDRPSTAPAVREPADTSGPRVLAPRDERAGGTWIGVNDAGVFAGITNRWTEGELAAERSRGLLVGDALAAPTAAEAANTVRDSVEEFEYDGFNLVVADDAHAILLEWDGERSVTHFDPGVHVVVNVGADETFDVPSHRPEIGERQAENARRVRAELAVRRDESVEEWSTRARRVLGDHDFGVCIHENGYGTRSASLVVVRATGEVAYEFAPGPPCETSFETVEHDLEVDGDGVDPDGRNL